MFNVDYVFVTWRGCTRGYVIYMRIHFHANHCTTLLLQHMLIRNRTLFVTRTPSGGSSGCPGGFARPGHTPACVTHPMEWAVDALEGEEVDDLSVGNWNEGTRD